MDSSSSDAGSGRGLRDRPLGKVALLLAVLLLAFLASRSCASRETEISRDEAVEIARGEIDFEPDRVAVRFVPRGVQSRPSWAVSLSTEDAEGVLERVTVVVVDGQTGDVAEVREQG
ncbi:MAG TPA: hypothetical protein VE644_12390 [Gaiellaceae bacterium]|nr:hypothetical protein [Gaiellaceae bacterium]